MKQPLTKVECNGNLMAIKDALEALSGKWKLPIIVALKHSRALRFKELQREVEGITPKILSSELKALELNEFLTRTVYDTSPVTVEYALTPYAKTLDDVISALYKWGSQHRAHIMGKSKPKRAKAALAEA